MCFLLNLENIRKMLLTIQPEGKIVEHIEENRCKSSETIISGQSGDYDLFNNKHR